MLLSSSSFKQVPLELRGEAYLKLNKLDSAIADFRQAYELDTFYTHYAKALGEAYNVIGQKDSAKKYMNIYTASQKQ
jgi:tetratricopeptide (TPR) repeat protein